MTPGYTSRLTYREWTQQGSPDLITGNAEVYDMSPDASSVMDGPSVSTSLHRQTISSPEMTESLLSDSRGPSLEKCDKSADAQPKTSTRAQFIRPTVSGLSADAAKDRQEGQQGDCEEHIGSVAHLVGQMFNFASALSKSRTSLSLDTPPVDHRPNSDWEYKVMLHEMAKLMEPKGEYQLAGSNGQVKEVPNGIMIFKNKWFDAGGSCEFKRQRL